MENDNTNGKKSQDIKWDIATKKNKDVRKALTTQSITCYKNYNCTQIEAGKADVLKMEEKVEVRL